MHPPYPVHTSFYFNIGAINTNSFFLNALLHGMYSNSLFYVSDTFEIYTNYVMFNVIVIDVGTLIVSNRFVFTQFDVKRPSTLKFIVKS